MASDQVDAAGGTQPAEGGRPFVLGIVGDSGSGKSTLSRGVRHLVGADRVAELRLDDYHRYTREERRARGLTALNPLVHNLSLLEEHLKLVRRGRPIRNRSYEHRDGSFGSMRTTEPRDFVLARGLLVFPAEPLRAHYDLAVFLMPEPDLLFRWKLRRDMFSRGYTEAEVLMNIAQHLIDSKMYVVPQAGLADVVVRHRVEDWEDPDSEVRTSVVARGAAADAAERLLAGAGLAEVATERVGAELVVQLLPSLHTATIDRWRAVHFPAVDAAPLGECQAEDGGTVSYATVGFLQVLVAALAETMRQHVAVDAQAATGA
jgi:uridine kinase